jgi:alanyl-tRNA synthetase
MSQIKAIQSVSKVSINSIRQSWLNLFQSKGYLLLEPSSLIPKDDLSLLWINSGVAALKKYFNKPQLLSNRNLVNCQPVIRVADLDQINQLSYHQTLFEMLGNFSINGNFKTEVIAIVWEWLTSQQWLNLDPQCLFITVWEEDQVSYQTWKHQGVSDDHILLGSKKSNFWDMGNGPCGPNSEIYYDLQSNAVLLPRKVVDLNNKRFIEIGNIVFPEQFHQKDQYLPLDQKCVDTGMGLERIAMILQNKTNAFEIDLWAPVIRLIENIVYNQNRALSISDIR